MMIRLEAGHDRLVSWRLVKREAIYERDGKVSKDGDVGLFFSVIL